MTAVHAADSPLAASRVNPRAPASPANAASPQRVAHESAAAVTERQYPRERLPTANAPPHAAVAAAVRPPPISPSDPAVVAANGLETCEQLLAQHLAAVAARFGGNGLGVIDLPDLGTSQIVRAQVQVIAVLYWAYQVEASGIIEFVETVAERMMNGTLRLPVGNSARGFMRFTQKEFRFTATERRALYERVFGPSQNGRGGFDGRFLLFVKTLRDIGRQPSNVGVASLSAQASVLAQDLGADLSTKGTGITGFAAREIVSQISAALRLLQDPQVARAFGGGSPWMILHRHGGEILGKQPDILRSIARANAGMRIIRWIADQADALSGSGIQVDRRDPVVQAAEAWYAWTEKGR
ncbi:MAG: hypothetical protein JXA30_22750 [Deltaproteobacteria bacterium]|nr:hypothetical protein [Deltaproteobacteria bacterium]